MAHAEGAVEPVYGEKVLTVEPYTIEHIPAAERHGRPFNLFPLWLGANLTIADYAIGFLPISLGLPIGPTIIALVIGNVIGGAMLAVASSMGPRTGYPQMIAGRWPFGHAGEYFPAALNWLSTVGWFTVNNILGSFGLQVLFPGLPFPVAAIILVIIQVLLTIFGHNLIHVYERIMSVLLGILFIIATIIALSHWGTITSTHLSAGNSTLAYFAIVLAAAFSYIVSWGPYASDYSRYLPDTSSLSMSFWWTFLGSAIASLWLEILGVFVAILAPKNLDSIAALHTVMGGFGGAAVVAIILGATAADALNLYSNSLSARALDIRVPRPALTVAAAIVGLGGSLWGSGNFSTFYSNFLLMLDYWVTPGLAVLFVSFFILNRGSLPSNRAPEGIRWNALISYLIGVVVSIPFMAPLPVTIGSLTISYTGFLAKQWGGADFSYFVGFVVAGVVYWAWASRRQMEVQQPAPAPS